MILRIGRMIRAVRRLFRLRRWLCTDLYGVDTWMVTSRMPWAPHALDPAIARAIDTEEWILREDDPV